MEAQHGTRQSGSQADDTDAISRSIAAAFIYMESIERRALATMTPSLTTAQYHALAAIEADPGGTLGSLAEQMLCDKANASGIVDRLAAMQLVDRRRDRLDRRRVALSLTSSGREALSEAKRRRVDALDRAMASLKPDAIEGTLVHLRTLVSALAAASDERSGSGTREEQANAL